MMEKYAGVDPNNIVAPLNAGRTGNGINMGLEAGGTWSSFPGTTAFYGPQLPGEEYGGDLQAGWAINSGRIAADHASGYISSLK